MGFLPPSARYEMAKRAVRAANRPSPIGATSTLTPPPGSANESQNPTSVETPSSRAPGVRSSPGRSGASSSRR